MRERVAAPDMLAIFQALTGLECWHVAAGGDPGGSFSLALGDKVRRKTPLQIKVPPTEFDLYQGYAQLMIWCSWRMERHGEPVTSSKSEDGGANSLDSLKNASILRVEVSPGAWDLKISFSGARQVCVFCDHVSDGLPDLNYSIGLGNSQLLVGPGSRWRIVKT